MNKVVKLMIKKINWLIWLVFVILWNYGFPQATPFQDVISCRIFVDFVYNYSVASIKILEKK